MLEQKKTMSIEAVYAARRSYYLAIRDTRCLLMRGALLRRRDDRLPLLGITVHAAESYSPIAPPGTI